MLNRDSRAINLRFFKKIKDQKETGTHMPIFETAVLYWLTQALKVAVYLEIPRLLLDNPRRISDLHSTLKQEYSALSFEKLSRVMRSLTASQVFVLDSEEQFHLGKIGAELLDNSIAEYIKKLLSESNWTKISMLDCKSDSATMQEILRFDAPPISDELHTLIHGFGFSKALYIFVQMDFANVFQNKSWPLEDFACVVHIPEAALTLLFALLVKRKILNEHNGAYSLSQAGKHLCNQHAYPLTAFVLHESLLKWRFAGKLFSNTTLNLTCSTMQEYLNDIKEIDVQECEIFNRAMGEITAIEIFNIKKNFKIPAHVKNIVDVGGNTGALLKALLIENPEITGTVFDLPEVVSAIENVPERMQVVGGSFFEHVPSGDMAILKRVIHDWDAESSIKILKNCADTNPQISLFEYLWNDGLFVACIDLELMSLGGKIRRMDDFIKLFQAANLDVDSFEILGDGLAIIHNQPQVLECVFKKAGM